MPSRRPPGSPRVLWTSLSRPAETPREVGRPDPTPDPADATLGLGGQVRRPKLGGAEAVAWAAIGPTAQRALLMDPNLSPAAMSLFVSGWEAEAAVVERAEPAAHPVEDAPATSVEHLPLPTSPLQTTSAARVLELPSPAVERWMEFLCSTWPAVWLGPLLAHPSCPPSCQMTAAQGVVASARVGHVTHRSTLRTGPTRRPTSRGWASWADIGFQQRTELIEALVGSPATTPAVFSTLVEGYTPVLMKTSLFLRVIGDARLDPAVRDRWLREVTEDPTRPQMRPIADNVANPFELNASGMLQTIRDWPLRSQARLVQFLLRGDTALMRFIEVQQAAPSDGTVGDLSRLGRTLVRQRIRLLTQRHRDHPRTGPAGQLPRMFPHLIAHLAGHTDWTTEILRGWHVLITRGAVDEQQGPLEEAIRERLLALPREVQLRWLRPLLSSDQRAVRTYALALLGHLAGPDAMAAAAASPNPRVPFDLTE